MKNPLGGFADWINHKLTYRQLLMAGYIFLVIIYLVVTQGSVGFDTLFVIFLGFAIFIRRAKTFIIDWAPFVLLIFLYESMRGIADDLNARVHITDLIAWERGLFGGAMPSLKLQGWLHPDGLSHWFDYIFGFFYAAHFIFPLALGFILWLKRRRYFRFFANGFIILTLAGFATYVLFPAMPPWMASEQGYLPPVTKILNTLTQASAGVHLPTVYRVVGANQIAAMPSLHAAWPWYTFLCLVFFFKKRGLWFGIVPLATWFGVVYLGEHYVIDVIAGIIYASLAFLAVFLFRKRIISKEATENATKKPKSPD
ncbi:MAG: phosphatase PAP2 family protein [Patescibacteria group bacterium]|nr:phosphatase PAP2 family protein [Patescibacteria group bacterium]